MGTREWPVPETKNPDPVSSPSVAAFGLEGGPFREETLAKWGLAYGVCVCVCVCQISLMNWTRKSLGAQATTLIVVTCSARYISLAACALTFFFPRLFRFKFSIGPLNQISSLLQSPICQASS